MPDGYLGSPGDSDPGAAQTLRDIFTPARALPRIGPQARLLADLELDLVVIISPMSSLEGHASAGFVDRYLYPLRRVAERRLASELRTLQERDLPTLVIQATARDLRAFSRNLMDSRPREIVAETAVETTMEILQQPENAAALTTLQLAARTAAVA